MEQIHRVLASRSLSSADMSVQFDTYFTMSGSMQRGTMIGGAESPEVAVSLNGVSRAAAQDAALTGIRMAPTTTLFSRRLRSLFGLISNGRPLTVGRVGSIGEGAVPQMGSTRSPEPALPSAAEPLISKLYSVDDKPPDAGISLRDSQDRALHIRASGRWRDNGMKQIDVNVIRPTGSMFRFLSDEPVGSGGKGRAPDALSLVSAGLGFCFMTQIGRFAKLAREDLGPYRIVQDTWFTAGDPTTEPIILGDAAAPQTHVFLEPASDDDDFARHALDMSEQTCFLHAMCRTELRPKVRVLDVV